MISFVIPAYNEARRIKRCLGSIEKAAREAGLERFEMVVADDASDDGTGELAAQCGARVVESGKRNIGATRNVGALAAEGDVVVFVDADSVIQAGTVREMMAALEGGAIGGGAPIEWTRRATRFADLCRHGWNRISRWFRMPAGSYFFVRKDAFVEAGGFDERYFATEELHLAKALKRLGRLEIVKTPILTSPRKVYEFSGREIGGMLLAGLLSPRRTMTDRNKLKVWYERRG